MITSKDSRVDFTLTVRNPHDQTITDVCGLLCFKFMEASWWGFDSCFFTTNKGMKTIADTEWIEGRYPSFQKGHVGPKAPIGNPVKNQIWTSNAVRVNAPSWVVRHKDSGHAMVFSCESAYYIHCNKRNP